MTEYCNQNDIKFDYKKLLVGGTSASKILLSTPLLQWYLKNNCENNQYLSDNRIST